MERLQKVIAAAGVASRRQAELLITTGKVSVNGKVVRVLGTLADADNDIIVVNGHTLPRQRHITYVLNKPRGIICSRAQQGKAKIVTELVPAQPPVYPVGRLDKESEGLILLTNHGELANILTHPSFNHPKEYRVIGKWREKDRALTSQSLINKLMKGVWLGDGKAKADKVDIKLLSDEKVELNITIHEGRTHLVRRMCASVGIAITRLQRVKIGILGLGKLQSGQYRILNPAELATFLHDA